MNKAIIRHGFILILLALVSGMFISKMVIPRLGLSAHTIGILSGVLLIGIGAIWQQFTLSSRQASVMYWSWLYSSYVNWFGCLVGAALGAGKTTPVASAGVVGPPAAEFIVAVLLMSVALASFIAVGLSIWGLRSAAA
mgnify:CR=1 FL=1